MLFVDVDGVISLFGFPGGIEPPGRFEWIDGIVHCIGHRAGARLARLANSYELVWATGWEEKANEYLVRLLELGAELPVVSFAGPPTTSAHWKLAAIEQYAGERPAAWVDDALDERCHAWAARRRAPTLLVETDPATGLTDEHVARLLRFAAEVAAA